LPDWAILKKSDTRPKREKRNRNFKWETMSELGRFHYLDTVSHVIAITILEIASTSSVLRFALSTDEIRDRQDLSSETDTSPHPQAGSSEP